MRYRSCCLQKVYAHNQNGCRIRIQGVPRADASAPRARIARRRMGNRHARGAGRRRIHRFVFFGSDSSVAGRKYDESEAGGLSHPLSHAHVQLLSAYVDSQWPGREAERSSHPPVADLPQMKFDIQWRELVFGHVVGQVLLNASSRAYQSDPVASRKSEPGAAEQRGLAGCGRGDLSFQDKFVQDSGR